MVYYLENGDWREMKNTRLAEKLWSYPVKSEAFLNSRTKMERTRLLKTYFTVNHTWKIIGICIV